MSKREARLARQAALESQKQRQRTLRIGAIAAAAVVVGGIIWLVVSLARQQPDQAQAANPNVTAEEITVPSEGATHLQFGQKATYQHYPPSSGSHWNQQGIAPTAWGYYGDALPPEVYVHNLEHGGIVLLIGESASTEAEAELRAGFDAIPGDDECGHNRSLLTADPLLDDPVAVIAADTLLVPGPFDNGVLERGRVVDFALACRNHSHESICY